MEGLTAEICTSSVYRQTRRGPSVCSKRLAGLSTPNAHRCESPDDPTWWECRLCSHHPVCHEGAAAEVTCRSCLHATPVEGGWHRARFDHALDRTAQCQGCPKHLFVPDLVPGEVVDAGDDHVVYRMADGSSWVNDAPEPASC